MVWVVAITTYLFVAVGCGQIFSAIGKRNSRTIGDSWTGDTASDMWSLLLWPVSLVAFMALALGKRLARFLV
jgi:hypothetical protein